jgi:hypothetical protein
MRVGDAAAAAGCKRLILLGLEEGRFEAQDADAPRSGARPETRQQETGRYLFDQKAGSAAFASAET